MKQVINVICIILWTIGLVALLLGWEPDKLIIGIAFFLSILIHIQNILISQVIEEDKFCRNIR